MTSFSKPFQFITIVGLLLSFLIPTTSKAQYISFSSFKMLQKASISKVNEYFVNNNWILRSAEDTVGTSMKYVFFAKGSESNGAGIKLSFDKDDIRELYRGNIIHYFTLNKLLFDKVRGEVKISGWKSDEPVIKEGEFLSCYSDGNNAILLGQMTKDGTTAYVITMVSWIEYYSGENYLNKDLGSK